MGKCDLCYGYRDMDGTHEECQEIHDDREANGLCVFCGKYPVEDDGTCWKCGKYLIVGFKNYPDPNLE